MTLIAAIEINNVPVMFGDIAISNDDKSGARIFVPTLAKEYKPFVSQSLRGSIVGLTRKIGLINDQIAFGWAGSPFLAHEVIKRLRNGFGKTVANRNEVFEFLSGIDALDLVSPNLASVLKSEGNDFCIIIGWISDIGGIVPFMWNSRTLELHSGGEPNDLGYTGYTAGSGRNELCAVLSRTVSPHNLGEFTNLDHAIFSSINLSGMFICDEIATGGGLNDRFGGGFESIAFAEGKFFQIGNITYTCWQTLIKEGRAFAIPYPIILNYQYVDDALIIDARRYDRDLAKNVLNFVRNDKGARYEVLPIYRDDYRFPNHPDFCTDYICDVFDVSISDQKITRFLTVPLSKKLGAPVYSDQSINDSLERKFNDELGSILEGIKEILASSLVAEMEMVYAQGDISACDYIFQRGLKLFPDSSTLKAGYKRFLSHKES